jgi:hypothetical protein
LSLVAEGFGKRRVSWANGDMDGNDVVDFVDFVVLADNFGFRSDL